MDTLFTEFTELAKSVNSLHNRFNIDGVATRNELFKRIPIQTEEVNELEQAIIKENPIDIANEAVDVLYVAIGTILRIEKNLAIKAIQQVIEKNDLKTCKTHHINDKGKISRISKDV